MSRAKARPSRRRVLQRLTLSLGLCVFTALVLTAAGLAYARNRLNVERVDVGSALSPIEKQASDNGPKTVENYLLVGSDTRATADPNEPDFKSIGNVAGQRSDTIMVMRFDPVTGAAALLSLPRDLWVTIAGTDKKAKINAAYAKGPETLIETVKQNFNIPIHHYVEVDFQGFKRIVDALGGITVCFDTPARDRHTGLYIDSAGCHELDGIGALQYVRSRYYETLANGKWKPTGDDRDRIKRQQEFLKAALDKAVSKAGADPIAASALLGAATSSLKADPGLNLAGLAGKFRAVSGGNLQTCTVPNTGTVVAGQSALLMNEAEAQPILDYFRGTATTLDCGTTPAASGG
jgi:LCP family protein required for cell wall assembly